MQTINTPIKLSQLKIMAKERFGNLVKAVVDVQNQTIALDAELHADLEATLLTSGSHQSDLWGINLYPDLTGPDFIEFDSMINVRPSSGNLTRSVDNPKVREKIKQIVGKLIAL